MTSNEVLAILQRLVDSGDLISWVEYDGFFSFMCWRLDPDRHPDEYQPGRIDG